MAGGEECVRAAVTSPEPRGGVPGWVGAAAAVKLVAHVCVSPVRPRPPVA